MARFLLHDFPQPFRKVRRFTLALIFVSGLIMGILIHFSAEHSYVSLMRRTAESSVSIVGLLSVTLLPFLFSAAAAYLSWPRLLKAVVFCKALVFALVSAGIMTAYSSGGWLMRFFLMFSDILSLPLLALFWLRYGSGQRRLTIPAVLGFLGSFICIGIIDILVISPFLMGL